jgi:hypothetical protein
MRRPWPTGGAVAPKTKNDTITACKNKFCERVEKRKEKANRKRVINYSSRFKKKYLEDQKGSTMTK